MKVKPAPGMVIRRPDLGYARMPPEGADVPAFDPYYAHLLKAGDINLVPPEPVQMVLPSLGAKKTADKEA